MTPETLQQPIFEFAPDPDVSGFRLHQLTVFNWGTFHEKAHTVSFDGRTSILTGGNGSGKSTLADALLTLLVENNKRNYNQAGQTQKRSERNEAAYVMGAFSEKYDDDSGTGGRKKLFLRKDPGSYTVLLATFHNADLNSWVTLAQVLWITGAGKVDKVFIVESRKLELEKEFGKFETTATIRSTLKERGLFYHERFSAYADKFRNLLCMPDGKSPMDIFNQAVCIKDISDLTGFIRTHMLDDGGAGEKLATLQANFADLRDVNRRIAIARKQLGDLRLIKAEHDTLLVLKTDRERLLATEETLVPFFAEKEIELRRKQIEKLTGEKLVADGQLQLAEANIERLHTVISELENALRKSDAGNRLKEIEDDLISENANLVQKKKFRKRFDELLSKWRENIVVVDPATFAELRAECDRAEPELKKRRHKIETDELPEAREKQKTTNDERCEREAEKRSLLDRENNIGRTTLQIRKTIADALKINPTELPFAGELLRVKDSEKNWTGAIERLLRDFAGGLIVRPPMREKIDAFVHANKITGSIIYHVLPPESPAPGSAISSETVAGKIEIKPGIAEDISAWLPREIARRFSHVCCENAGAEFKKSENAITRTGLIKDTGITRRKDDSRDIDNRAEFILGWDNREKIEALGKEIHTLEIALDSLEKQIKKLTEENVAAGSRINAADELRRHFDSFADIDWGSVAKKIENLEAEQTRIKNSSDQLKQLEDDRKIAKKDLAETEILRKEADHIVSITDFQIKECTEKLNAAGALADAFSEAAKDDPKHKNFRARYAGIADMLAFPLTDIEKFSEAKNRLSNEIRADLRKKDELCEKHAAQIKFQMRVFANDADNIEFKDRLAGDYMLPGYSIENYAPFEAVKNKIESDDLPKNETRFRQLLHTTVYGDVNTFHLTLQEHAETITRKIGELNGHLSQIDFDRRDKTFINLVVEKTADEAVRNFRQMSREAMSGSLNETDDEAALKERYERVEVLLNALTKNPDWADKVIDVRNWFVFRADEFFRETRQLKQSYSGATGKSGGEKNRLASTVLAAAIAYQYGIELNGRQTETFRLVAVDEMFSKTDDEFSGYLLDLFKEFHLQLIIIQPLDAKIHLVQKYVERYHIVTKRNNCSAVRTLTVHEYENMRRQPEQKND